MAHNSKTPVMVLQEVAMKSNFSLPDYNIVSQISGTHMNRFDYVVLVGGIRATGSGPSKQLAKHQAAHNALVLLEEEGIYNPAENPVSAFKAELQTANSNSSFQLALNCIVELQNLCIENKVPYPEFVEISSVGPPHNKEFTYECKICSITTEAKAGTKKMAKQLAAKEMLSRIKDMLPDLLREQDQMDKSLTDKSSQVIAQYQDLREIIPDKAIKISEMSTTLAKMMMYKGIKYEDLVEDLKNPSEESLQKILTQLETGYVLDKFQDAPTLAILILKIDTPFTMMGSGKNYEEAKCDVLVQTFAAMDNFMKVVIGDGAC